MEFESFGNLFDALTDTKAESAKMEACFTLLFWLETCIRSWGVSSAIAAQRLGIARPELDDILRYKLRKFSPDSLTILTAAAKSVVLSNLT